jgi:hypothetical protein
MQMRLQRIIAVFTAVAVLAVSFNCACAGMTSAHETSTMCCCAHHHPGEHCKHQSSKSSPCSGACEHCSQSAMNDTIASPSFHAAHAAWNTIHSLPSPLASLDIVQPATIAFVLDPTELSPPSTSSTLLSLHCALIV